MIKTGRAKITSANTVENFVDRWTVLLDVVTNDREGILFVYAKLVSKVNDVQVDDGDWTVNGEYDAESTYSTYIGNTVENVIGRYSYGGVVTVEWLTPLTEVTA